MRAFRARAMEAPGVGSAELLWNGAPDSMFTCRVCQLNWYTWFARRDMQTAQGASLIRRCLGTTVAADARRRRLVDFLATDRARLHAWAPNPDERFAVSRECGFMLHDAPVHKSMVALQGCARFKKAPLSRLSWHDDLNWYRPGLQPPVLELPAQVKRPAQALHAAASSSSVR